MNIIWTQSHIGVEGNEKADRAARETGLPIATDRTENIDMKAHNKKQAHKIWNTKWRKDHKHTKLYEIKNTTKPWPLTTIEINRK